MTTNEIHTWKSTATETGPADLETEDSADAAPGPVTEDSADAADEGDHDPPTDAKPPRRRRSISIGVRSLVVAVVIVILAGAVGTLAWLYVGAERKLDSQASESANNARVEKIALDYAVNAATMDFKDLQAWKVKLVAGTGQQLNDKLTKAAESMEQILVPLQWISTAKPLVATVRSSAGGIYVVDCFVSVQTKTVQASDPLQSTATYSVTIDSNQNWVITDIGGIGSVVGQK
jgi:Mce-associated membrane protein